MNESCHIHEWVMSHTWMSHVTHMNESCHIHERFVHASDLNLNHDSFNIWHDSFIYATWLIHVCDMTRSCMWHDSFIYVTLLIFTHSKRICACLLWSWPTQCLLQYVTWLLHICDMTHSCIWHDSFMYVIWLLYTCHVTRFHTQQADSRMPTLILTYSESHMTHLCVWPDSFMYVTWLIYICDVTHFSHTASGLAHAYSDLDLQIINSDSSAPLQRRDAQVSFVVFCDSMMLHVAVCRSTWQCVAVCCFTKSRWCFAGSFSVLDCPCFICCSMFYVLQCVAVCCSVLQCVAVCCSVLKCVAVCFEN